MTDTLDEVIDVSEFDTDTADVRPENTRKISVAFARKVSDGNYGTSEARAWVEGYIHPDSGESQVAIELGGLFMAAAAAVFDQLGVAYHLDPDTQTLREDLKPLTEAQAAQRLSEDGKGSPEGGSSKVRVLNPENQDGPLPQWLIDECERLGVIAVFDNRKSKTGNQPWFKEGVSRGQQGHGKDGSPKGFWPPK